MSKSTALRTGVIAGISLSLLLLVPYFLWGSRYYFDLVEPTSYGAMLLTLATGISLGIRHKREKVYHGTIPFSKAFGTGWMVTIVAGVVVYLCIYLFLELKGTEWMTRYYEHRMEQLQNKYAAEPTVLEQKIAALNQDFKKNSTDHLDVNSQAMMIFFIVLLFGTIISLAAAAIQRSR